MAFTVLFHTGLPPSAITSTPTRDATEPPDTGSPVTTIRNRKARRRVSTGLRVTIEHIDEVFIIIPGKLADDVPDALIERLAGFVLVERPQEDVVLVLPHFQRAHLVRGVLI